MFTRLIAGVVVLALVFGAGWKINGWRLDGKAETLAAAQAQAAQVQETKYRLVEQKAQQLTDQLAAAQAKAEQALQQHQQVISKEVLVYEKAHATCSLDADWVRIHNAAASNVPQAANATGGASDAPATAATALAVITGNYAIEQTCASRLAAWQTWWKSLNKRWWD